jgi:pyridoxal 5'-phosphate synthase pdxS subunit
MDVTNAEQVCARDRRGVVWLGLTGERQARIAEEAGACAVMALERVPADIRKEGGVARMVSHMHTCGGAR